MTRMNAIYPFIAAVALVDAVELEMGRIHEKTRRESGGAEDMHIHCTDSSPIRKPQ